MPIKGAALVMGCAIRGTAIRGTVPVMGRGTKSGKHEIAISGIRRQNMDARHRIYVGLPIKGGGFYDRL